MEISLFVKNLETVEKVVEKADRILVTDDIFRASVDGLSLVEIGKAVEIVHRFNKKLVVKVDRLYHENEIADVLEYLKTLDRMKVDAILVSDIGLYMMVKKNQLALEVIYAPETLLTNRYECETLKEDGIDECVISKDIPLIDVLDIISYNADYCSLRIHGPILIAYSWRRYISAYLEEKKEYVDNYRLVEENRENELPIIEREKGTWVYTDILESFGEIEMLNNTPLKSVIIDNVYLDDKYSCAVLDLYLDVLNQKKSALEALECCKELNSKLSYLSLNEVKKTQLDK